MRQRLFLFPALLFLATCWSPQSGPGSTLIPPSAASGATIAWSEMPLAHAGHDEGDAGAAQSGWQHFVSWVGHFHPAMTVFPIAMVLSAALAELLRIFTKAPWLDGASRWCVIIAAIGGVITAPLGWAFAAGHGESRLLEVHRWLGTGSAAGAVALLFLSELARRRGGAMLIAFRVLLFLAVPLVGATGYFGGAMVYGTHEYDWNPPEDERAAGSEAGSTDAAPRDATSQAIEVTMSDDESFKPDRVTIPIGSIVRWKNTTDETHTVTNDPKSASNAADVSSPPGVAPFNSGKIKPGQTFEHRFTTPGTYRYVCAPHENMDMKGELTVTLGQESSPPSRPANSKSQMP